MTSTRRISRGLFEAELLTIPAHYDGSIIQASLAEADTPGFRERLGPLICERLKLGVAPPMRIDSEVGLKRGRVGVVDRGEEFIVEYLAVISGEQAIVPHAAAIG